MNTTKSQKTREQGDQELAEDLLAYLAEHPGAMDTREGIAEWWLLRQRVRVVVEQVDRVLRRLTEEGTLKATGAGAARRYRLANQVSVSNDSM